MANIDDLKTSISEMDDDQALALVLDLRQNRRSSDSPTRKRTRKKKKRKKKAKKSLIEQAMDMEPEQLNALIEKLKNGQ